MHKKLVSLLTPCYNSEKYIHRLLDSVLSQSYPNIEMIIIDDGSTDDSSNVVKKYIPKFSERGYTLHYEYQRNGGQSVAIRNGLQMITGEYLAWPDSDDYFSSKDSISKMVSALISAPSNVAIVRTMQNVVDEVTMAEQYIHGQDLSAEPSMIFEDCLFNNSGFYWGAGAYMMKTSALYETTHYDIYTEKDAGQNWQLFLPVMYSYKCVTIRELLYSVLARQNSHSRGQYIDYNSQIRKVDCFERVVIETIKRIAAMPTDDCNNYIERIREQNIRERLRLSYNNRQRSDYQSYYKEWAKLSKKAWYLGNVITYIAVKLRIETIWDFIRKLF